MEDKGTSWARGFFRLWVVISLLWVAFIGAFTWEAYSRHMPPTTGPGTEYQAEAGLKEFPSETAATDGLRHYRVVSPSGRTFVVEASSAEAAYAAAKRLEAGQDAVQEIEMPDGSVIEFPVEMPDEKILDVLRRANPLNGLPPSETEKAAQDHFRAMQFDYIRQGAVAGFLPPIVLLALGLLVGWALRGFRGV